MTLTTGDTIAALLCFVTLLGVWIAWRALRQGQKDMEIRQEEMHNQNREDNKRREARLDYILEEHTPHSHTEAGIDEPLTSGGVRYPKAKMYDSRNNR